jgi:hypothetical protein
MRLRVALILAVAAVAVTTLSVGLALRESPSSAEASGGTETSGRQTADAASTHIQPTGGYELSDTDAAALSFMREEEKLARDVYSELAELYGLRVFSNISASESKHMDAVAELLDAYDLADPAAGAAPGEFRDESLQALYDRLITQGSRSLSDALAVGVIIEETDIADLQQRLAATDNPEIEAVFDNLLSASERHLGAFERQLSRYSS